MTEFDAGIIAFAVFGVSSQAVLVCFFVARRWSPGVARRFGWLTYAFVGPGLLIGVGLFLSGESWRLVVGPLLMAVWALVGAVVDLWRPHQWRDPIKWNVFVPYVGLYFWGQMFLWWPLWDVWRAAWAVFLVLFVVNSVLNISGHFSEESHE